MRFSHSLRGISAFLLVSLMWTASGHADQLQFFKIGSGSKGGVYYPIAYGIASAISNPPMSKSCEQGGNCGVPGLVASAEPTGGSVANVDGLTMEKFHAGIVQSDVAYWAYTGTGPFRTRKRNENLCAIASLYNEAFHLVRSASAQIEDVIDLKGKRVALGAPGSGSLIGAQLVVRAYGFAENKDFQMIEADFQSAQQMMTDGQIDAFAYVTAFPNDAINKMTKTTGARVVSVSGKGRDKLVKRFPFYTAEKIPAGTYAGQDNDKKTLAVPALLISRKSLPDDKVYKVTKAFWKNPATRSIMDNAHERGKNVTLRTAFKGISIPYCDGARKFYRQIGKLR